MVQQRILSLSTNTPKSYSRPISPSLFVPIRLEWEPPGKVVTETTTEYREANDDSDFANFGLRPSSGFSSLLGSQDSAKWKEIRGGADSDRKSGSSSSSDEDSGDTFEEQALKAHNEYREKHGAKPLKLDRKLCEFALKWAETLAKGDRFEHNPDQTYGENIYCTWSTDSKPECKGSRVVSSWYSEASKYDFDSTSGNSQGAGHFTQVVWKGSKRFGIGKAKSAQGKIIVVANYDPPGNFIGQYSDNVGKPN